MGDNAGGKHDALATDGALQAEGGGRRGGGGGSVGQGGAWRVEGHVTPAWSLEVVRYREAGAKVGVEFGTGGGGGGEGGEEDEGAGAGAGGKQRHTSQVTRHTSHVTRHL